MKISILFKRPHWLYLFSLCCILVCGSIAVFSATRSIDTTNQFFTQHIVYIFIGIALFVIIAVTDSEWIKILPWGIYLIGIILLLILFGKSLTQSSEEPLRWIFIGRFSIQPSEFMKLGIILVIAKILSESQAPSFLLFLQSLLITIIPVGLIIFQPDLGTAVSIILVYTALVFFSRINILYIIGFGSIAGALVWFFKDRIFHEYQWNRIVSFLNPNLDPTGENWSVQQALIAIGSGGMKGKGYLKGTQSKMGFLPDTQYSDFIFAVIGEEFGFFGAFIIIVLFLLLIGSSISIGLKTKDLFQKYVAFGITSLWFIQIFINVGMNIGIMPVTGLPLPFISYGGSALLTNLIGAGLLYHIHIHQGQIHYF